jgi:DNA-binding NarL/FixJ family response regulator
VRDGDKLTTIQPLRCVVVEDQLMFLQLLVGMLHSISGLKVVATATTADAGIRICRELLPDLLILDLCLPDQAGITVAEALAAVNPRARVIVLSAAASGFVCDPALDPMLHAVVDKVDACETLAMEIAELLGPSTDPTARLTEREEEVLVLIGQGLPNRRIAEQLGLSVHTVDTHRRNICQKLGVKGGELVREAALQSVRRQRANL